MTYLHCYDRMLTKKAQRGVQDDGSRKDQKADKKFLCLNEDGKTYTAALVEALAQASTAAVSYNLADGGPNITSPGQTGEAWKSGK